MKNNLCTHYVGIIFESRMRATGWQEETYYLFGEPEVDFPKWSLPTPIFRLGLEYL